MRNKLNILSITSESLKKGDYKNFIPEYYALKKVIENNSWHINQNVFDHSVAVFKALEKILKLDFLKKETENKIEKYLKEKIGDYTRKELLIIATLLHDIAKSELLIKDSSGKTSCPGHEIIGSLMVDKFAERFNLDKQGKDFIGRMIHYHGFVSTILTLILEKKNSAKLFNYLKKSAGDIYIELLLFIYADILGSDLKKTDVKGFKDRIKIIIKFLEK
jgi:hypothetical protein